MGRKPKKSPPINGGSMSDISFLLLSFFLLTSSINTDVGLLRQLPPPVEKKHPDSVKVKERNVLAVLLNFQDRLSVNGQEMDIVDLRETTKEFFTNPNNDLTKPEKEEKEFETLGTVICSKGVVSLLNDNSTSYAMYIKVQNELTAAFNELRDEYALEHFGVKFTDIKDEDVKKDIQKAIPMAISEAEPKDYGGKK
ncbi:MAG: biopolymer transporter ExbD [Bacteroidales bacterium]|jgi:biopolymer transport protein ExbD|nr:biopolymer transporter ExbD [Bacteroidales bacterium]